ncbi:conserved hypothetical protein [Beggiatoa sp. PS]|nr:conserved hypothetical protein [Beggiatoa sp. PS]
MNYGKNMNENKVRGKSFCAQKLLPRKHIIRVYNLPTDIVRLDATTASSHIEPRKESIFQLEHSKDHRPDLVQVKIMLASLDPLGLPLASQIELG